MKSYLRKLLNRLPAGLRPVVETAVLFVLQRLLLRLRAERAPLRAAVPTDRLEQLRRQVAIAGYAVVPNFKSVAWCEQARREVLDALNSAALTTQHPEDSRVFGIEGLCDTAREFASDPLLNALASTYARSDEALMFCMANRVEHRAGVVHGSGGEWHRDSLRRELKAMLYLTDVRDSDGPFTLVRASHRLRNIVTDVLRLALRGNRDPWRDFSATRLRDAGTYLQQGDPGRAVVFTASRGTLLLFDTSAIHTGMPPMPGGAMRLALTNYYCARADVPAARAYYQPLVKLN